MKTLFVGSEMENGRHKVYNSVTDILDPKDLLETLDVVADSMKCAARLNIAFSLVLKMLKTGVIGILMNTKKI